jgi:hypothetical protein
MQLAIAMAFMSAGHCSDKAEFFTQKRSREGVWKKKGKDFCSDLVHTTCITSHGHSYHSIRKFVVYLTALLVWL